MVTPPRALRRSLAIFAAALLVTTCTATVASAESSGADPSLTTSAPEPPPSGDDTSASASSPSAGSSAVTDPPSSNNSPSSEGTEPPPSGNAQPTVEGAVPTPEATTAGTAGTASDPEGAMSAWTAGDGLIYFSGYAFDRDDFGATVTTMYTLDGTVVGFQPAQLRSPELDPYGLPYKGVFGAFQAPSAGQHQLCMFIFNIGGGTDTLASCVDVNVPSKNPRGDIVVEVIGSQIRVNGWLFDESNPPQSLAMWVVDNGQIVSSFVADAPSPYLYPYGVFGNHAFGTQYTPSAWGSHRICVYGINIGFGQSSWIDCDTVYVSEPQADPTQNDPDGGFVYDIYDYNGNGYPEVYVDGWAYDPNSPSTSLDVALFIDGEVVGPFKADGPIRGTHPYGLGNHSVYLYIGEMVTDLASGTHDICLYAFNIGPGSSRLVECRSFLAW